MKFPRIFSGAVLVGSLSGFASVLLAAPNPALVELARKGEPAAQLALALRYFEGRDGISANASEGLNWATRAAEQGYAPAAELLGQYFLLDPSVSRNPGKAAHYLQRALEGNPQSQTARALLGLLYYQGRGVMVNREQGLALITAAADGNNAIGVRLASLLKNDGHLDQVLPRTEPDAALLQRAEGGDAEAQHALSVAYANGWIESPEGSNAAQRWRQRAAAGGSAQAQYEVGLRLRSGMDGYAKDISLATDWLKRAAESNYGPAQAELGRMYFQGEGVAQDEKLAAFHLRNAVEQNQQAAEAPLGILLATGRGVDANPAEAFALLRGAERRDDLTAREFLSRTFLEEKYEPSDAEEMVRLLRYAIKQRNNRARELLGMRLYTGDQVKQDVGEAVILLEQAAEGGSALAVRAVLDYLSKRLATLGSRESDNYERKNLFSLHQKMTVLYGLNGESADRLVAAKVLGEFRPIDPQGQFLPTGVREAVALLRIYRAEGGTDREALRWLAEVERQIAHTRPIDLLEGEYREKMARRQK
ncbi:MAG: tetratricopeptide repeat protein [Candidatus Didemnitutus sp.]|nr:tetratricopeptide repeat protein [Candidatus Didemnitutus sp.]